MVNPKSRRGLRRDLSQVPITSLAFYRAPSGKLYVLAGEDSDLALYEAQNARVIYRIPVFVDQPIHGIHVHQATARVLVWGSQSVAFLSVEDLIESNSLDKIPVVARTTAPDWIYHGAISPFDPSIAVLATAHNEVVPVRYSHSTGEITLGAAISPSRPMLYSAHLTWISEDCVLFAGGTVFGHVIVWKLSLGVSGECEAATEMLFNLQGHEGSIFGVDISLVTLSDGTSVRLLASCSDDRTIHIWDITERGGENALNARAAELGQVIDTGFGVRNDDDDSQEGAGRDSAPIAVVMGHASRIWGVKFAPLCGENTLAVYSFGEDSTAQKWTLQLSHMATNAKAGQEQLPLKHVSANMTHDKTFSLHNGKHLWSNTLLVEEDSLLIATGGADSQICLIEEPILASEQTDSVTTLDVHDIFKALASPPKVISTTGKEIISRYDFLSHDQILVTTSHGRLLLGSLKGGNNSTWQDIDVDETLSGGLKLCYVLKTISHGAALLGTTNGNIYHFHLSSQKVSHIATVSGKIFEINCLSQRSQDEDASPSSVDVLVHLHGTSDSHSLTLDPSTGEVHRQEQIRGLDARFVATSAAKIDDLLIIGSRRGWLSILKRDEADTFRPVLDVATRSRDTITSILPLPRKSNTQESPLYILATSRDGKYRIYELDRQAEPVCLHLRHETSPPFGPVVGGAWFTRDVVPELILYGFRSKDFVIWNETRREELATVECGGAHRTFQLAYSELNPSHYRFAFTKTSKLSLHSSERIMHRSLKSGTHGREIRALSSNGRYIATGAEDTSIRIWQYRNGEQGGQAEMRCVATMKTHVTGLQRLVWFEDDYLFSSAGNEEFFVWRVSELESDYTGLAVFCEGAFTDKSADGDLRIMDFDVCRPDDGKGIIVTMGFSNSTLKTYRYTCDDGGFELVAEGSYTGACFTQTRHLGMRDEVLSVLTASTDGHIALWRAEPGEGKVRKYVLGQVVQLHQNSIKGLDMLRVEGGYCVMTGGDDNGVGAVTLVGDDSGDTNSPSWTVSGRSLVRSAHAAAVTGVVLVRQGAEIIGVSVSNDQRVKAWDISGHREGGIKLLETTCSGVADPGDIAVVDNSKGDCVTVMIGGVGVEAWNLPWR